MGHLLHQPRPLRSGDDVALTYKIISIKHNVFFCLMLNSVFVVNKSCKLPQYHHIIKSAILVLSFQKQSSEVAP